MNDNDKEYCVHYEESKDRPERREIPGNPLPYRQRKARSLKLQVTLIFHCIFLFG